MSTETTVVRQCPSCGKTLKIPAKYVGLKVACNACNAHFVVKPATAGGGTQLADIEERISDEELEELKRIKEESSTQVSQIPPQVGGPESSPGITVESTAAPTEVISYAGTGQFEYLVAKVHLGGRMVQANIEEYLNKNAAEGWRFCQAIPHGTELYVVFERRKEAQASGGEA